MISLIMLGSVINYLTRSTLAVAAPTVLQELHIGAREYALLRLAGFAPQTLSVTVITMSSDLFRRNEVATAAGMAGTFGNAGLPTAQGEV